MDIRVLKVTPTREAGYTTGDGTYYDYRVLFLCPCERTVSIEENTERACECGRVYDLFYMNMRGGGFFSFHVNVTDPK